jgi:hypothetical protein
MLYGAPARRSVEGQTKFCPDCDLLHRLPFSKSDYFGVRSSEISHGDRGLTQGLWLDIFAPQAAGTNFFAGTRR